MKKHNKLFILVLLSSLYFLYESCLANKSSDTTDYYILTPKPPAEPRINGPKVFGVRPASPFLFTVPATGQRPLRFSAENLPDGLTIGQETGQISGRVNKKGTYKVVLKAQNNLGSAQRDFRIVIGDKIALTPPMGWNSWNCWMEKVDDRKVRKSARAMVDAGLINHGWSYINIDDGWQGQRAGKYNAIQGNEKFPDIKALCDYVHSLGLKIGIYSSPYITTYAGYIGGSSNNPKGSWKHPDKREDDYKKGKFAFDVNDAMQWAEWGIDYLKYDWNLKEKQYVKPMTDALRNCGRDILYSLSNSGRFEYAQFYADMANCWRTTGDIRDIWYMNTKGARGHCGIVDIWDNQSKWKPYNKPGSFNDPDMLVVGKVSVGHQGKVEPTRLTADEQYTHISLWCLWSAPLLIGCPLEELDDFTRNLLTNDEVLAVNQDPLVIQAERVFKDYSREVWAKDTEDGAKAVGLFNRGRTETNVTIKFSQLKIKDAQKARDLWRQKDLGIFTDNFTAKVPPHGVVLVKLTSLKN